MSNLAFLSFGIFLIAAFFGLTQTEIGLEIGFIKSWTNSRPQELYFFLGSTFLLLPGAVAVGWAVSPVLMGTAEKVAQRLATLELQERWAGLVALFSVGVVAATLLNHLVFLGQPFTDDESAIRYGGRLLASGKVSEAVPDYMALLPDMYLYARDGEMTSFDWLGGQVAWAIAELTATENAIFAVLAAAALTAVVALVSHRIGARWGVVAAIFFLCSPMALTLSGTTHAHVISRGLFGSSLLAWSLADENGKSFHWWLAGFLAASAWITRPPEITALWLPLGAVMLFGAWKGQEGARRGLLLFACGAALPLVAFIAHSVAVTGTVLPARFAANDFPTLTDHHQPPLAFLETPGLLWTRFGANFSYNLFMLTIYLLGPVGLVLVILGATVDRFTKLLATGVMLGLGIALLHDDYGLHIVGPIHYSEAAVPLIVLAVYGLRRLYSLAGSIGVDPRRPTVMLLMAVALAFGLSNLWYLSALHRQAQIHDTIYGFFEADGFENTVVLGPSYAHVWEQIPEFQKTGTFVYSWRRMAPGGNERVVFGHYVDDPASLQAFRERFPERQFLQLGATPEPPYLHIRQIPR